MIYKYEKNGARKKTLRQFIDHITEICSMASSSGILAMRFMDHGEAGKARPESRKDIRITTAMAVQGQELSSRSSWINFPLEIPIRTVKIR